MTKDPEQQTQYNIDEGATFSKLEDPIIKLDFICEVTNEVVN